MSLTYRLEMAVKAKPGLTTREAAAAVGLSEPKGIARVSALLHQSAERGKVRREGTTRAMRHFPTEKTGQDQRKALRRPNSRREQAKARRAAAPPPAKAPAAPARAPKPPKPSPEQVASVSALFHKPTPRLRSERGEETVAQFQARGGVIQRLPPGACSRPLASFATDDDIFPL